MEDTLKSSTPPEMQEVKKQSLIDKIIPYCKAFAFTSAAFFFVVSGVVGIQTGATERALQLATANFSKNSGDLFVGLQQPLKDTLKSYADLANDGRVTLTATNKILIAEQFNVAKGNALMLSAQQSVDNLNSATSKLPQTVDNANKVLETVNRRAKEAKQLEKSANETLQSTNAAVNTLNSRLADPNIAAGIDQFHQASVNLNQASANLNKMSADTASASHNLFHPFSYIGSHIKKGFKKVF